MTDLTDKQKALVDKLFASEYDVGINGHKVNDKLSNDINQEQLERYIQAHPDWTEDQIKEGLANDTIPLEARGVLFQRDPKGNLQVIQWVRDYGVSVQELYHIHKYGYETVLPDGTVQHHDAPAGIEAGLKEAFASIAQNDGTAARILSQGVPAGKKLSALVVDDLRKTLHISSDDEVPTAIINGVIEGISKSLQADGIPAQVAAQIVQGDIGSLSPADIKGLRELYKQYKINDPDGQHTLLDLAADKSFQNDWQQLPAPLQELLTKSLGGQSELFLARLKVEGQKAQLDAQTIRYRDAVLARLVERGIKTAEDRQKAGQGDTLQNIIDGLVGDDKKPLSEEVRKAVMADFQAQFGLQSSAARSVIDTAQASYANLDAAVQTKILTIINGALNGDGTTNFGKLYRDSMAMTTPTGMNFPAQTQAQTQPGQPIGPAQLGAAVTSVGIDVLLSPNGLPVGTLGARLPRAKLQMGEPDPHILPSDRRIIENGERIIREQPRKTGPGPVFEPHSH